MKLPYLILAGLLIVITLVFIFTRLPKIKEGEHVEGDTKGGVVMAFGGQVGVYAFIGIGFFMSIMYPTQFSLALKDLGKDTKSGSAFLVMAIVANACVPQFTAYIMHHNEHIYQIAYIVPLVCFIYCAYYGWKGYRVKD